jgi:hypothetical protein
MRIGSGLIFIACFITAAFGQAQDPHVHVRSTGDPEMSIVETDYLTVVDTADEFLRLKFSTVHRKSSGLSVTIEGIFAARQDLYDQPHKREFSLIVDGDRFDYDAMLYARCVTDAEGEHVSCGSVPWRVDAAVPPDAQVRANTPIKDLVFGRLEKVVLGFGRNSEGFERMRKAKRISLKVGNTRTALTEQQVDTLRNFIERALHG